jgi:hypothetical protein
MPETRTELKKLNITALKALAKNYKVPKYNQYKVSDKDDLINVILKITKSPKKSSKKKVSTKPKVELNCDIPNNTCEKSAKYKKADIEELAKKCGVTNLKGTRKELCQRIANVLNQTTVEEDSDTDEELEQCVPIVTTEDELCFDNNSKEQLLSKKGAELKELLDQAGVSKGKPTKKNDIVEYLCAIKKNKR